MEFLKNKSDILADLHIKNGRFTAHLLRTAFVNLAFLAGF